MSRPELRRLGAAGCLLAALSSQQIGYAAGALDDSPLVAGMVMVSAGAGVLAVSVHWRGGGLRARRFDRAAWWLVARVAISIGVIGTMYLLAVQRLSLGIAAAVMVLGPLAIGLRGVWRARSTAWGRWHLVWRGIALAGVVLLNRPWRGEADPAGLCAALAVAVASWNYVVAIGRLEVRGLAHRGTATAGLLSAAVLITVTGVLALGGTPGGNDGTSGRLVVLSLAGVLAWTVPTVLQNIAVGLASARDLGVLYSLESPVAALIAQIGVCAGLLNSTERPGPAGWVAITMIVAASAAVSLRAARPDRGEGPEHR
ncbi:hypothetical protein OG979_00705 [Actinomadura citrea]|uniref:hypothetical protein n=1 Tax=Actinomadura citrea TaxID=46158 RepID=UPI002E295B8B|nr:hypothetical protein [Actinomadura citrea]